MNLCVRCGAAVRIFFNAKTPRTRRIWRINDLVLNYLSFIAIYEVKFLVAAKKPLSSVRLKVYSISTSNCNHTSILTVELGI